MKCEGEGGARRPLASNFHLYLEWTVVLSFMWVTHLPRKSWVIVPSGASVFPSPKWLCPCPERETAPGHLFLTKGWTSLAHTAQEACSEVPTGTLSSSETGLAATSIFLEQKPQYQRRMRQCSDSGGHRILPELHLNLMQPQLGKQLIFVPHWGMESLRRSMSRLGLPPG